MELLKNINGNGDMLNMTDHDSLKTKKNPFNLPIPLDAETKGLLAVKEFDQYCKSNGIVFFMSFPNIIKNRAFESEKYRRYFDFLMEYFNKNNIEVLGTPQEAMYPKELFFDSEYHLISRGSDIRTADFIEIINQNAYAKRKIDSISKVLKVK